MVYLNLYILKPNLGASKPFEYRYHFKQIALPISHTNRFDKPDRIDLVNVVDQTTRKSNARGRLVAGNKIYGIKKEFLSHYAPDSDCKFRCPFMDMIHDNYNFFTL